MPNEAKLLENLKWVTAELRDQMFAGRTADEAYDGIAWLYGEQNQVRPMFPPDTPREDLIRASKSFDLAQHLPPVDWSKALWHLPEQDIIKAVDGPRGIFETSMPVETGGKMIQRAPNAPGFQLFGR